mgnify:CR=1 FL=1|jgi:4-amino-4-deoxy-L-arabinose transferase-like glycosyltransferase
MLYNRRTLNENMEDVDPVTTTVRTTEIKVFALFLALAAVSRVHTFFLTVIDWDETTYALLASSLLHGHLPYTQIWDNKPPLLYLVYALFQLISGDSVFSIRLLAVVFTAGNAYMIRRIGLRFWTDGRPMLAGLLYLAVSLTNGGLSANSEHIFMFFALTGFWLLLAKPRHAGDGYTRMAWAGFFFGLAFQVKYFALTDTLAGLAGYVLCVPPGGWRALRDRSVRTALLITCATFGAVSLLVVLIIWLCGIWPQYWDANFVANSTRAVLIRWDLQVVADSLIRQLRTHPLLWICFAIQVFTVIRGRDSFPRFRTACILWIILDFLAILSTRSFYHHYYLPLFPGLCLLSADCLQTVWRWLKRAGQLDRVAQIAVALLVVLPLGWQIYAAYRFSVAHTVARPPARLFQYWDTPAEVADYLRARLQPGETIYVADYHHVIYFLLHVDPPTRYVGPPFVIGFEDMDRIAGVDGIAELDRIMARQPAFVVTARGYGLGRPEYYEALDAHLSRSYTLDGRIGPVAIYRRVHPAPTP